MYLSIKTGAIFIADSHFNIKNNQFLNFLEKLQSNEIVTSQLFLMGDMFDFISGESKYFIKQNSKVIKLLNKLSNSIEIVYLEGNHDYNLEKLFPNILIVKRQNQPFLTSFENKTVALSHGDNFINWKYDLYCSFIRNSIFLKIMNFLDFEYFISKKIEKALLNKNICHNMLNFEQLVTKRINNYKTDIIIEGHYHQGKTYIIDNKKYINIPSLCCTNTYMKLENSEFNEEKI